jgi:hypothetical protein
MIESRFLSLRSWFTADAAICSYEAVVRRIHEDTALGRVPLLVCHERAENKTDGQ